MALQEDIIWITSTEAEPWQRRTPKSGGHGRLFVAAGTTEHQTWRGFGGCFNEIGYDAMLALDECARSSIIDSLFGVDGCKFTIGRLPIGASDYGLEWYSHNEHAGDFTMEQFAVDRDNEYLLPYIRLALDRRPDMTLFASPWSPPTWLKRPRAYNNGTLILEPEYQRAYALYFVKFVQAYAAVGVKIAQIHIQNEPDADQKFPSCLWTGAQMRDFIRDYLGPAFRDNGIDAEIWLGTLNTEDYDGFTLAALTDPEANRYIAGVGYQWAGKAAVQRTAQSWPDKGLMQTENECGEGSNDWKYATYVFELIRHYVANGCDSYVYWNIVLPSGGASTWGWRQNSMITVDPSTRNWRLNPEYHVMRHYSDFVAPGAKRASVRGPWSGNTLAFRNPDGTCVAILNNPLTESVELTVDFGDPIVIDLPSHSFHTIVFGLR